MATPTSDGVVSRVELTGYNEIDSLIHSNKWGRITGANGINIDIFLDSNIVGSITGSLGSIRRTVNLTYSFGDSASHYISRETDNPYNANARYAELDEPFKDFDSLTDEQKTAARNSFNAWSEIANISFEEVRDSSTVAGDIRLARTSAATTAHAYLPSSHPEAGDIWFSYNSSFNDVSKGTYGYSTFLHEIGHALGLVHPHEGEIANRDIDLTKYSVMSYRSYPNESLDSGFSPGVFFPTTPMLNDIAAIQYLYGANTSTRNGNDVYSWQPGQQILETIWDGGGIDTIDWSNQSTAALINLNAGEWSELGPAYWNGKVYDSETLAIAYDVTIENAVGGTGNDSIIGNQAANLLVGGKGNDTLTGANGNDTLRGYGGAAEFDILTGGAGRDYFELGNSSSVFCLGEGYATITDFSSVEDQIILSGDLSQYTMQTDNYNIGNVTNDTMLFYENNAVALFQDTLQIKIDNLIFV